MNLVELDQALRKLRLSGMADVLDTRLLQAQAEQMAPIDLLAALVTDELQRREDRLLARRHKQARFRDSDRSLDGFDFAFNKKINRALVRGSNRRFAPSRTSRPDGGTAPSRKRCSRPSCRWYGSTRCRRAASRRPSANGQRPMRSTRGSWRRWEQHWSCGPPKRRRRRGAPSRNCRWRATRWSRTGPLR